MIDGYSLVVVMPAYNAEKTLHKTYDDLPHDYIDHVILVDDCSDDKTAELARSLGITTVIHNENRGYGGNQKSCYRKAMELGADIVVMVHPDYQYSPRLVMALAAMITSGHYDAVLGSRILGGKARAGGMPLYKYIANRFLTAFQNLLCGAKLSEYHTGFRAFSKEVLCSLPLEENSEDFVFDNQMLAQILYFEFNIGEVSCPTRYSASSSSINLKRSVIYGLGVMLTTILYFLAKRGFVKPDIFNDKGRRIVTASCE